MKHKTLINLNSKLYDLDPKSREWELIESLAKDAGYYSFVQFADAKRWDNTIQNSIINLITQIKLKGKL